MPLGSIIPFSFVDSYSDTLEDVAFIYIPLSAQKKGVRFVPKSTILHTIRRAHFANVFHLTFESKYTLNQIITAKQYSFSSLGLEYSIIQCSCKEIPIHGTLSTSD